VDTTGFWNISYRADEDFDTTTGGVIEVEVPAGWSAPQNSSAGISGYVALTDVRRLIRSRSPATPFACTWAWAHVDDSTKFLSGDRVSVLYGVGECRLARAQTNAPDTAVFLVRSDPQLTGTPVPIATSPRSPSCPTRWSPSMSSTAPAPPSTR